MDQDFDQMIRDRMKEALEDALKSQALGPLPMPQETSRQRLQHQLGDLLIIVGTRLRDGASSDSAALSHGRA